MTHSQPNIKQSGWTSSGTSKLKRNIDQSYSYVESHVDIGTDIRIWLVNNFRPASKLSPLILINSANTTLRVFLAGSDRSNSLFMDSSGTLFVSGMGNHANTMELSIKLAKKKYTPQPIAVNIGVIDTTADVQWSTILNSLTDFIVPFWTRDLSDVFIKL